MKQVITSSQEFRNDYEKEVKAGKISTGGDLRVPEGITDGQEVELTIVKGSVTKRESQKKTFYYTIDVAYNSKQFAILYANHLTQDGILPIVGTKLVANAKMRPYTNSQGQASESINLNIDWANLDNALKVTSQRASKVKSEYIKYRERINSNRNIKVAKRILKQQLKNDELQGSVGNNEMLGTDVIQEPRATRFSTEED